MASVGHGFEPNEVVDSVKQAWRALADQVWNNDLKPRELAGTETETVWKRQIDGFWEIA